MKVFNVVCCCRAQYTSRPMMRSYFGFGCIVLAVLLCACPSTPPGPMMGPTGNTGASCDLEDRKGILGSLGATGQTMVGAACSADYDCSQIQTCVSQKCAANQTDDKTQAELTIDKAGDYLVTVTGPADREADAGS